MYYQQLQKLILGKLVLLSEMSNHLTLSSTNSLTDFIHTTVHNLFILHSNCAGVLMIIESSITSLPQVTTASQHSKLKCI